MQKKTKKCLSCCLQSLLLCAAVCCWAMLLCSCSDEEYHPAVGLTAGDITPQGSFISYRLSVEGTRMVNAGDSVDYDVTDEQLRHALLHVTPTIFGTASYNGVEITDEGIEVDATQPVVVTVMAEGHKAVYTIDVLRATQPGEHDAMKKVAASAGFADGAVSFDVVEFKGRLYALVVKVDAEADVEDYLLYVSDDALQWEQVEYEAPWGQFIGGEGCRLAVLGDELHVIGGARTRAKDRIGLPPELATGMYSGQPTVATWREFATKDGVSFWSNVNSQSMYYSYGIEFPIATTEITALSGLTQVYGNVAVLGDELFLKSGYMYAFGMPQPSRILVKTNNGVEWENLIVTDEEGNSFNIPTLGDAFFSFKGRLWVVGGFANFLSPQNVSRSIYSSEDGTVWRLEGELPDGIPACYQWTGIGTENVAYIIGGERLSDDGTERTLSTVMLRSTDGVEWEQVPVSEAWTGSRMPRLVAMGETLYIFGSYKSISTGNYVYPTVDDQLQAEVWSKFIK